MLWKKYTIRTNTADCDMVCAVLMDYGITDVQIENNVQLTDEELNRMYADFVKELPADDGACAVIFYLDENGFIPEGIGTGDSPTPANDLEGFEGIHVDMDQVKQGLTDAHELFGIEPVSIEETSADPQDWNDKWKENFRPFNVGHVIIKPTWEALTDEMISNASSDGKKALIINIDPGMAFGTGRHETTRLCLEKLQDYIKPGDRVLDLGCGSGILGIAALKSGASFVMAVDIDPEAVRIAGENFELNAQPGEEDRYRVFTANVLGDEEIFNKLSDNKYDIVIANILAEVIVPLSGMADRLMKDSGIFISSGIIDYKLEEVLQALEKNRQLELENIKEDGEWRAVTARKVN